MELELDESYAEKTKRGFQKKVEGKKREAEKRANKMGRKVSKQHSKMRVRDYEYDYEDYTTADLRRFY